MWTTSPIVKYTQQGTIKVSCRAFNESEGLRNSKQIAVEITVGDTGCGIPANKLESIFREFERVESAQPKTTRSTAPGLGLGLAVVARSVEQLGGQLRVDSKVDQGSKFSFIISFTLCDEGGADFVGQKGHRSLELHVEHECEVPDDHSVSPLSGHETASVMSIAPDSPSAPAPQVAMADLDSTDSKTREHSSSRRNPSTTHSVKREGTASPSRSTGGESGVKLRILSVEVSFCISLPDPFPAFFLSATYAQDNDINRLILDKRLRAVGHTVINTTNGKEGVEMVEVDQAFDCVLMDVQ